MAQLCSWDSTGNPSYNYYGTGNVEEVIPGVLRPLSADLILAESNAWARNMVDLLGVRDQVDYRPLPYDNIFAIVGGRVAVNILWLGAYVATYQPEQQSAMLAQYLRGDDEGMKSGVAANVARARRLRKKVERLWAAAPAKAAREVASAERWRKDALNQRKLARESDQKLIERIEQTIERCGASYVRHAQTTMGGGEFLGMLSAFLDEKVPGHPPEWTTTLTSALGDVVSTEPVHETWRLAQIARKHRPVAAAFERGDFDGIRGLVAHPPDAGWTAFATTFEAFIDEYGFRGQAELDPAVPDWGEDPTFVLSSIRTHLTVPGARDPAKRAARAARARERLEAQVEKQLRPDDRPRYRQLLEVTQSLVRARELTKANLARTTRAYRPPILELGRRFADRGLLARADDIWYLRLDELRPAADGSLNQRSVRTRIARRRDEHARLEQHELPVVFSLPVDLIPTGAVEQAGNVLSGQGVSPGVARGRARVILSAEAGVEATIEDGEILVAPITDTAWTPLFWPAAGVVVERGGMLSHASTVARELGLPAVVGVANATRLIPDGATVTVDGAAGTVTIEA